MVDDRNFCIPNRPPAHGENEANTWGHGAVSRGNLNVCQYVFLVNMITNHELLGCLRLTFWAEMTFWSEKDIGLLLFFVSLICDVSYSTWASAYIDIPSY